MRTGTDAHFIASLHVKEINIRQIGDDVGISAVHLQQLITNLHDLTRDGNACADTAIRGGSHGAVIVELFELR